MTTLTASKARASLYRLLDQAAESHEPIQIMGKRHNGVLISEEDWNSIQETLFIVGIPGLKDSIIKARKMPTTKFQKTLDW